MSLLWKYLLTLLQWHLFSARRFRSSGLDFNQCTTSYALTAQSQPRDQHEQNGEPAA